MEILRSLQELPVPSPPSEVPAVPPRKEPRIPVVVWTKHALARASERGVDVEALGRKMFLASRAPDHQGKSGVFYLTVDARALWVHPELEPFFGVTLVLKGWARKLFVLTVLTDQEKRQGVDWRDSSPPGEVFPRPSSKGWSSRMKEWMEFRRQFQQQEKLAEALLGCA